MEEGSKMVKFMVCGDIESLIRNIELKLFRNRTWFLGMFEYDFFFFLNLFK